MRFAPAAAALSLLVAVSAFVLLAETSLAFEEVLFEVVSAFGTVGLSTGITADLPGPGQLLLIVLMFVGRIGPITLASALALRQRGRARLHRHAAREHDRPRPQHVVLYKKGSCGARSEFEPEVHDIDGAVSRQAPAAARVQPTLARVPPRLRLRARRAWCLSA